MKKGKRSFVPMNMSFLDELDCSPGTTDEENEDLPCEGNLGIARQHSNYSDDLSDCACIEHISDIFFNGSCSEDNKNVKASADAETHPQTEAAFNGRAHAPARTGILSKTPVRDACPRSGLCAGGSSKAGGKEHLADSKMSEVLLRHFSTGELITTCQLIECETIPEVSFTESIDEASGKLETSELAQSPLSHGQPATNLENYCLEKCEKIDTGEKDHTLLNKNIFVPKRDISETSECGCIQRSSPLTSKNEDTLIFQNPTKEQRDPFDRTASSQCGKSQVHYCLPHFSAVAKGPEKNSNNKPVPITERAKAFPILPNKSVTVDDIVENKNCFDSVEIENQEEMSVSELLQQLQMLTEHADTQNHIDQLRFNSKIFSQSAFPNPSFAMDSRGTETSSRVFALYPPTLDLSEAGLQCGAMVSTLPPVGTVQTHGLKPSSLLPELTQGEKMAQILQEQTDQLKKKVEDFSQCKIQETFLLQDKYLVLNHLKRCLGALEQNYLTAKEEHRNLQLQNKDTSINVGKFDPDRKVEGEIFTLGMLLEDIHEESDDSKCSSPPLLTPYESAHSSYSLWEGSGNSSIIDLPERTILETAFLYKNNKEKNISQKTDAIPRTNHELSLEGDKHNRYPCVQLKLQKKDELNSKGEMQPLIRGGLLANKHSPNVMRFLSPEKIHGAEGLGSYTLGKLGQTSKADEESMKRSLNFWQIVSPTKARSYNMCSIEHDIHLNILKEEEKLAPSSDHCFHEWVEKSPSKFDDSVCPNLKIHFTNTANKELYSFRSNENIQERKTGSCSIFIQGKPTDLSDTNLSSDSEDISACSSNSDSRSEELLNHKTENHKIYNTGLHGERKGIRQRCTRRSRDQGGQALESDPGSHPLSRSRAKVRSQIRGQAYSQKIISCTQKAYRHKPPHHLIKRLSERQNMETVKTCYSSTHDTVIFSPQYLPRKTTSRRKSAVNIRNRNMRVSDANILSSTLDHAIQTANSLKRTTERMMQAVSEDLAKVRSKQL